jgi:hypothetical protein
MNAQTRSREYSARVLVVAGTLILGCAPRRTVVEEHLERWRASHVVSYKYVVAQNCMPMCPPLEIEVRNGSPFSVRDSDSGKPVVVDADTRWLLTIDSIFAKLKTMRVSPPEHILQVDYDPVLGYPIDIRHFPGMGCYDCGTYVVIRDFQRT